MKRYMILLAWITGILFPIAWVGKLLPGLRRNLGPIVRPYISPEWVHVAAHTALFAGLVLLLVFVLRLPRNWLSALFLLTVVMALGISQEGLQLVAKDRGFGWPEVFDLGVDITGGVIGWWLWGMLYSIKRVMFRPQYTVYNEERGDSTYI
jgi:hypothetical protein